MHRSGRLRCAAVTLLLVVFCGTSASAQAPFEPNDSLAQAYGPLLGGTDYSAAFETTNDPDWFYWYSAGQAQVDIALTNTGPANYYVSLNLRDANGGLIDNIPAVWTNQVTHMLRTIPGAATYYFEVITYATVSGQGYNYRFRIDPASAVTTTPPQPPAPTPQPSPQPSPSPDPQALACNRALRAISRLTTRVKADRHKVARAKTRKAKRRWRSRLRSDQRALRIARRRASRYC